MEGELSTAGIKMTQQDDKNILSEIGLEILRDILELAYQKWQREKRYNPISEFNSIKVLSSYNEVLYQRNINSEKDQLYYNFLHRIGKQIPKGSSKDEWMAYCQQLFNQQDKQQKLKTEKGSDSMRDLSAYANKDYANKLMMKSFIVLIKHTLYKRQKKKESFKQQQKARNSPINQQDTFIPDNDQYIQYKRSQYKNSNLKSESSQSHLQNLPLNSEASYVYNRSLNQMSPPTYHVNQSNFKNSNKKLKEITNLPQKAKNEYDQVGKKNNTQSQEINREPHYESIRQMTLKESIEYQRSNNDSFSYHSTQQQKQTISPSSLPLQPNNSPIYTNNPFITSPNRQNNNNSNNCNNNNNYNKRQKDFKNEENYKGFQELETVATASNADHFASTSSNANTFRNKTLRQAKSQAVSKDSKTLINCMYDNLDIIETNMEELGENAINMTKMSADFDTSCISKGRNNTKFLDESYSFHQTNATNNLFQTGNDESFEQMSFQQTDLQATLPHKIQFINQNQQGDNLKQWNNFQTNKNFMTISARDDSSSSLYNLDFNTIQENIKVLSAYFIKLQIYKNQHKKKRQLKQQILNLEKEAELYYIRKLKDKVFCLLKAFGIVSSETQERYNYIKSNNEGRIKRKYLFKMVEKYHEQVLERTQVEYLQKNIESNLLTKAFQCFKEYHQNQFQKRMAANSLIFTSRTSIEFIIELYLNNLIKQHKSTNCYKIYEQFQECKNTLNYKPLIASLIKNGLMSQKNSKLLLRQQENVILNKKYTYFSVLKSLYQRNQQAQNIYNYKVMQKVFNVFQNYSQERIHLKNGLEQFISGRLQHSLIFLQSKYYFIILFNKESIIYLMQLLDGDKLLKPIEHKKEKIKDYQEMHILMGWNFQYICNQMLFQLLVQNNINQFKQIIQQSDKQKIFRADTLFFQVTCKKVLFQLKKSCLENKSKKLMNVLADKNSNNKTLRFYFDIMIVFQERARVERQKSLQIELKRNLITQKQCLTQWRLQRFYNKIIQQFRLSNIFQKFLSAYKLEKEISNQYQQKINEFKQNMAYKRLKDTFQIFQNSAALSVEYYRDAFSFHYNTLLRRGFNILRQNKDIKQQKYSNVYEYLSKTYFNFILPQIKSFFKDKKTSIIQQNAFYEWKQRTLENEDERKSNKLALNFYIKKLFTLIIRTLQNYTEKQKIDRQNKDLAQIYYKNNIWKKWRERFIDKLVVKHDRIRLMTLGMRSLILALNLSKQKKQKIQKADYFMYMMLFKKAQYFIEVLKINKEKSFFKRQLIQNAQQIIEKVSFSINQLEIYLINFQKNCKIRILRSLQEYTQKNREQTKKYLFLTQIKNLNTLKVCFIELMKNLANKKIMTQKIYQKLKLKYKSNLKKALNLWKESIHQENQEMEIYDKGVFLQQTLLKKRFFNSLKSHHQTIFNDKLKHQKADKFYQKQLFYKFMGVFYKSIEEKKLKFIATKHFASNLIKRGFFGWKKYQTALFEERYKKVDDYFENPFLMSQKKSTISLADKENFDLNYSNMEDIEKHFDSIMSYSSDKKNKSLNTSYQNSHLKIISNYRK